MWVFNGEAVQKFLDNVAEGFQLSPLEVALFVAELVLLLVVPFLLWTLVARRRRLRSRAAALASFEAAAASRGLNAGEVEALVAMARRLSPDPQRWAGVLTRAAAFNAAAARAGADATTLARLRWKLQLLERGPRARLHSTVELEPDEAILVLAAEAAIGGRVTAVTGEHFEVSVGGSVASAWVTVRVSRDTGVYDAEVPVLACDNGVLRLGHGKIGSRVQNRRFLRRSVRGSAVVATASGANVAVRLVDLSGGGARLRGPSAGIRAGDEVTLRFGRPGGAAASFPSRVTRVGAEGFSLAFENVPAAEREELIRLLGR